MVLNQKQGQQFVQCFQLSIDDLEIMIKEAVKSVIPPPKESPNSDLSESNSDDNLLSPREVMKLLKVSSTTLWRFKKQGILKPKSQIGRKVYYSKKEVFNFINNSKND